MTYNQKCIQCDKDFESEKPAKYCSSTCRSQAHRNATAEPNPATAEIDIGYGLNDYTRKMVEDRVATGDTFKPNWYGLGFESKNHFKSLAWKNI